jgi:hypothetical protein
MVQHTYTDIMAYIYSMQGSNVSLRLVYDRGQLVFITDPPQCRPRHALVPRWHYDMVLDGQRNLAYESAIK